MANYWNFRNKDEDGKPEIVLSAGATADRILLFNILSGRYGIPRIAEGKSKDGTTGELVIDFSGDGPAQPQAFTIPDYDSEKTYNSGDVVSAEVGEVRGIYRSDVDGNALAPGEAMGWNFYDGNNPQPGIVTTDYVPETLYNGQTRIRVPLSEIGISGSGHFVAIVGGNQWDQLLVGVEMMNQIKDYVLTGFQHTGVFLTRFISNWVSEEGIHLYVNSNNKLLKIHDYSPESSYMQHLVEDYYGALEFPISSELVAEINESMSAVAVKVDHQYFINGPDAVSETDYIQNESSPGDVGIETWTLLATAAFGGGGGLPGGPIIITKPFVKEEEEE